MTCTGGMASDPSQHGPVCRHRGRAFATRRQNVPPAPGGGDHHVLTQGRRQPRRERKTLATTSERPAEKGRLVGLDTRAWLAAVRRPHQAGCVDQARSLLGHGGRGSWWRRNRFSRLCGFMVSPRLMVCKLLLASNEECAKTSVGSVQKTDLRGQRQISRLNDPERSSCVDPR